MSLRSTKSLPNLKKAIKLEYFSGLPATPCCNNHFEVIQKKYVHHTNKNDHTILLTTNTTTNTTGSVANFTHPNAFSGLSVKDLKLQCRSRGLKVSGTKNELISRLSTISKSTAKQQSSKHLQEASLGNGKSTGSNEKFTSKPAKKSKKRKNLLSAKKTQDLSQKITQSISSTNSKPAEQSTNKEILSNAAQSDTSKSYAFDQGKLVSNTVFPHTSPRNVPQRVYMPYKLSLEVPDVSGCTRTRNEHTSQNSSENNSLLKKSNLDDLLILKQLSSGLSVSSVNAKSLIKQSVPSSSDKKDEPFTSSTKPLTMRDKVFFITFVTSTLYWWDILPVSLLPFAEKVSNEAGHNEIKQEPK